MMYYPPLFSKGLAMLSMAVLLCLLILSQDYISLFSFQGTHRLELRSSLFQSFCTNPLQRRPIPTPYKTQQKLGGLEWNRTIDLTLIRRAL